jgi:hypothetical protein
MRETRPETGRERRLEWYFILGTLRFGLEVNTIHFVSGVRKGERYLDQFLLHLGLVTLRVHRFLQGDDGRAVHDHPFWFITFPLHGYYERYWDTASRLLRVRYVKPWRFHFRPAKHRHIVLLEPDQVLPNGKRMRVPAWTFAIAGRYSRTWGFWPTPSEFIPASAWEKYCRVHKL